VLRDGFALAVPTRMTWSTANVVRPRPSNKPTPTIEMPQMVATNNVSRSRFFSTTDDPDSDDCMVPPNNDDRPPPLPRCKRMSAISAKLVITSRMSRKIIISALLDRRSIRPDSPFDLGRHRV
jgi:hypothetical protein